MSDTDIVDSAAPAYFCVKMQAVAQQKGMKQRPFSGARERRRPEDEGITAAPHGAA
jgi:hypothetical protein